MIGIVLAAFIAAHDSTPGQKVAALGEEVFRHEIADNGLARLRYGLPVDRLADLSAAANEANLAFWRSVLRRLDRIPERTLTHDEVLSEEIMRWQGTHALELAKYYWFSSGATPYASRFPSTHQLFAALPVATPEDRDRYLSLARQYAKMVRDIKTKLEGQVARHLVLPKVELALVVPFWKAYRHPPASSPLWVGAPRLAAVAETDRAGFTAALTKVIDTEINPALDGLIGYLEGPYTKAAPDRVGLAQYPDGKEYYRALVRFHTTMDQTPESIFLTGQREIDSLTKELDRARRAVGFTGTLDEFKASLRTNPRFFVKTPEEVGQRLEGYAAQMETKLDSLFSRRPKAPYGVARLAAELEPNMTYGYYDAPQASRPKGVYFYNGSKLAERNLAMAEGLTYHELVPGHHFQIALQQENTELPRFRRELYFTANGEGWGDYASMLGSDAGLYQDPYSRAGRLMMEMMLGTRLVLDVGMNYYGWPLERARQFMREHTLETETQIQTETLRYGVDIPGQALAYRMGSLTIRRLREHARQVLGARWDVRKFHDAFLESGPMPLMVLARHVDQVVIGAPARR